MNPLSPLRIWATRETEPLPQPAPALPAADALDPCDSITTLCVKAGVSNTARAWSAPTALATTFPPPARWAGLVLAGQLHADNRQKAPAVVREKPLDFHQRQIDRSLAYGPFVGTLVTHTRLMQLAKEGKGPLPRLTQVVEGSAKLLASESAARNIGAYVTFVGPRVSAQLGASAIGSVASHRWVAKECQARPRRSTPEEQENGGARHPEAYAAAGVVFAAPALLATPRGTALLARHLGRAGAYVPAVLVPVSCVVADEAVVQASEWAARNGAPSAGLNPGRRSPAH